MIEVMHHIHLNPLKPLTKATLSSSKPKSKRDNRHHANHVKDNDDDTQSQNENEIQGFDRGLAPQKIFGATKKYGELMFLMKWQGSDDSCDLVLGN